MHFASQIHTTKWHLNTSKKRHLYKRFMGLNISPKILLKTITLPNQDARMDSSSDFYRRGNQRERPLEHISKHHSSHYWTHQKPFPPSSVCGSSPGNGWRCRRHRVCWTGRPALPSLRPPPNSTHRPPHTPEGLHCHPGNQFINTQKAAVHTDVLW